MSGRRWILFIPGNILAKVHPTAICSHDSPRVGPCVIINKMRAVVVLFTIVALMVVAVMPLGVALGQDGEVNPVRALPDGTVYGGETFNVTVTFTSPTDQFNNAVLIDFAPDGWNVTVDKAWCTPNADAFTATGNKAEIGWYGEPGVGFDNGTSFSALYKATVPDNAELGIYAFSGSLEYYLGEEGPYLENTTGGSQVEVVGAGGIGVGVWWIVGIVVGIAIIVVAILLVRRRRV